MPICQKAKTKLKVTIKLQKGKKENHNIHFLLQQCRLVRQTTIVLHQTKIGTFMRYCYEERWICKTGFGIPIKTETFRKTKYT